VQVSDPGDLRDRLLAVAALGAQRRPAPDRPWTGALAIEQELLAAADAIVSIAEGDLLVQNLDAVAPASDLDAGAAFARTLSLGNAPGAAPAEAAARALRLARPEARPAVADALALAQSPAVGAAVARLLDDSPPAVCAAALGVLRYRRQGAYGSMVLLLAHPDAAVAAAAIRCLGTVPERRAAASVLRYVLSRDPIDAVALPAAEVLLALGDPAGLVFVRTKLEAESVAPALSDDARVGYLRLLGLAGEAADRELFFRSVEPSARDAAAVGWFGHPDLVEWLLGSLEAANDTRRAKGQGTIPSPFETAAARALQRVLGSPHTPALLDTHPSPPEGLIVDAAPWRAFFQKARIRFAGRQKLRFGRPYTPVATLEELEADAPSSTRADAALELAILSRGIALLETDDWVARQRAVLTVARALLGDAEAYPAGAFVGSRLAER
jgi:hypothetical protein